SKIVKGVKTKRQQFVRTAFQNPIGSVKAARFSPPHVLDLRNYPVTSRSYGMLGRSTGRRPVIHSIYLYEVCLPRDTEWSATSDNDLLAGFRVTGTAGSIH